VSADRAADLPVILGGYSLAGLFALWTAYQTDCFAAVAAVSPSVWFPEWIGYAETHSPFVRKVYLSLGDKEEKTRNPVMAQVGSCIRRQLELLQKDETINDCVLEMNEGNHFKDPDKRCAKAFAWCMRVRL
jgi:predicted alpha/beta superfamily hydrolase